FLPSGPVWPELSCEEVIGQPLSLPRPPARRASFPCAGRAALAHRGTSAYETKTRTEARGGTNANMDTLGVSGATQSQRRGCRSPSPARRTAARDELANRGTAQRQNIRARTRKHELPKAKVITAAPGPRHDRGIQHLREVNHCQRAGTTFDSVNRTRRAQI